MTPEEREQFYLDLVKTVRRLQRTYNRVYPKMIVPHIDDFYRCEQTLRRDMAYLANRGDLIRVPSPTPGVTPRRGYQAPRYIN